MNRIALPRAAARGLLVAGLLAGAASHVGYAASQSCLKYLWSSFAVPGGPNPRGSASADFNADGIPDLALVNSDGANNGANATIQIMLGTGARPLAAGSFTQTASYPHAGTPFGVEAIDVDRDGIMDLVTPDVAAGSVSILRGRSIGGVPDGTFHPPVSHPAGFHPFKVVAGDWNEDNRTDLAVVDNDAVQGGVSILLGTGVDSGGNPTFGAAVPYVLGTYAAGVAAADFDEDSHTDLVVTLWGDGKSQLLRGVGDGSFVPQSPSLVNFGRPFDVEAGDIDGDGHQDIAFALDDWGPGVQVLWGLGNASFATASTPYLSPFAMIEIVPDGDGTADLIVGGGNGARTIRLLRQGAPRSFTPVSTGKALTSAFALVARDMDVNGTPDLVASEYGLPSHTVLPTVCIPVLAPGPPTGSWTMNGEAVCLGEWLQAKPAVLSDGAGGLYVVWEDYRGGADPDLYAQRLGPMGDRLWGDNGKPVCVAPGAQTAPRVAADGTGGLYVSWTDRRSGTNYPFLQHLASNGTVVFLPANGVQIGTYPLTSVVDMVADDIRGVYVAALENRDIPYSIIYRLRPAGTPYPGWPTSGVVLGYEVSFYPYLQWLGAPRLTPGVNGAHVAYFNAYQDCHHGCSPVEPAARTSWVSGTGVVTDRVLKSAIAGPVTFPRDAGRALLLFLSPASTLIAVGLSATGTQEWESALATGLPVGTGLSACSDGLQGAYVTWTHQSDADFDLSASRLDATGARAPGWEAPLPISLQAGPQGPASLVHDGANGAVLAWQDLRSGDADIYVQRLAPGGGTAPHWPEGGYRVVTLPSNQTNPLIERGDAMSAIVLWEDERSGPSRLFAQRVDFDAATPTQVSLFNTDARPDRVAVTWHISGNGAMFQVERAENAPQWTALLTVPSDGGGIVRLEDRTVKAATRYGYRLRDVASGQVLVGSEVWVTTPATYRFSIAGVRPNPGPARDIVVELSTPAPGAVTLEVFDVSGRRVGHAEHALGDAGTHRLRAPTYDLRPGLYLMRAGQAGRSGVARFVVLDE